MTRGEKYRFNLILMVSLLAADLFMTDFQFMRIQKDKYYPPWAQLPALDQKAVPYRMHFISPVWDDNDFWRVARLDQGPGYLMGVIRNGVNNYQKLTNRMGCIGVNLMDKKIVSFSHQPLLNYLGVKYLVCKAPFMPPAPVPPGSQRPWRLMESVGPFSIYQNIESLPRFGLYRQVRVLPQEKILDCLLDPGRFHPETELLTAEPNLPLPPPTSASYPRDDDISLLNYSQSRVVVGINAEMDSVLSAAEVYFPGWRVWVDGRETKLFRANYAFQAALVPAGKHLVEFRFLPWEFRLGLWITLASAGFALLAFIPRMACRRPRYVPLAQVSRLSLEATAKN